jgi:hypothetical protein
LVRRLEGLQSRSRRREEEQTPIDGNVYQNISLRYYGSKRDEATRNEEEQTMKEEIHGFHFSSIG